MHDILKMVVPGKAEYVGTVRMAVAHMAGQAGFDIEAIDDIKVAVSEACTNSVLYANDSSDFTYDVIVELEDERFSITVNDKGSGFNRIEGEEPDPEERSERGLGVIIIKALMDEVDINSELGVGTSVRMTKILKSLRD